MRSFVRPHRGRQGGHCFRPDNATFGQTVLSCFTQDVPGSSGVAKGLAAVPASVSFPVVETQYSCPIAAPAANSASHKTDAAVSRAFVPLATVLISQSPHHDPEAAESVMQHGLLLLIEAWISVGILRSPRSSRRDRHPQELDNALARIAPSQGDEVRRRVSWHREAWQGFHFLDLELRHQCDRPFPPPLGRSPVVGQSCLAGAWEVEDARGIRLSGLKTATVSPANVSIPSSTLTGSRCQPWPSQRSTVRRPVAARKISFSPAVTTEIAL